MGVRGGNTLNRLRKLIASHSVAFGLASWALGLLAIFSLPGKTLLSEATWRLALAAVFLVLVALATGLRPLRPTGRGFGEGMRMCWYMLIITAFIGFYGIWESLGLGSTLSPEWPTIIVEAAFLCIAVGIVEELLFRGIVFNLFAQAWGSTGKGLLHAAVVSSVLFGFGHVVPVILFDEASGSLAVTQEVLKTIEAAMMGVLFAAVLLRTRNIWVVALAHALADFLPLLSSLIFGGSASGGYVSDDPTTGLAVIIVYCLSIALSLPYFFPAVESILSTRVPRLGIFSDQGIVTSSAGTWRSQDKPPEPPVVGPSA